MAATRLMLVCFASFALAWLAVGAVHAAAPMKLTTPMAGIVMLRDFYGEQTWSRCSTSESRICRVPRG